MAGGIGAWGHEAIGASGHRHCCCELVRRPALRAPPPFAPGLFRSLYKRAHCTLHTAQHRRVCEGRQEGRRAGGQEGLQSLLIRECGASTTAGQPETAYEEVWQQRGSWGHAFTASPHHRSQNWKAKHALLCSVLLCSGSRCARCVCVAPAAPTLASGCRQDSGPASRNLASSRPQNPALVC